MTLPETLLLLRLPILGEEEVTRFGQYGMVATTAQRIIEALTDAAGPLSDAQLSSQLGVQHQAINQTCRQLEARGVLARKKLVGSSIVNVLTGSPLPVRSEPQVRDGALLAEDEVKAAVRDYLEARGYGVKVAWGHERGIDIEAHKSGDLLLIEAKGEAALQPQQVNYFVGALGELVQRLAYPDARYGLALPDNRQYRNLVGRLPAHARRCLKLVVFFVSRSGEGYEVAEA